MLLGRLDSYDEGIMLNQFVWGLQSELARSISLQYPESIVQAISLGEMTELAVRASKRPGSKSTRGSNLSKGPNQSNRGKGQWRGYRGRSSFGRGRNGGSSGTRGGGRSFGGRGRGLSGGFDPLACY